MVNSTYYFAIWLPLLSFGIAFYIATLFVLFKKMKDSILGKIFFKIHLVLGVVEILCSINMHIVLVLPKFGILVDEFYLPYVRGFWTELFVYLALNSGAIQYSIISLILLNRVIVLADIKYFTMPQINKICKTGVILCLLVPPIIFSPVFYMSTAAWVDYRINSTDISSLKSIAQYQMSNTNLYQILGTIMTTTKLSNIVFNFVVFITIIMYFRRQQKKQEHNTSKINMHEIKIAIAVILVSIINGVSAVLLFGMQYWWSQYRVVLFEFIGPIEDTSRMLTPVLLFLFSKPLRNAFQNVYQMKTTVIVSAHSNHF